MDPIGYLMIYFKVYPVWVVGKKDQILEKTLKTDQKIAKKKTLADQIFRFFGKNRPHQIKLDQKI